MRSLANSLARTALLVLCFLPAGTARADCQIGYVPSYDGKDLITDSTFPFFADLYFQDGDPLDGVVRSKSLIIHTECYAGDHADNYDDKGSCGDGFYFDTVRFTNATVIAGNPPGKVTTYHFLCDLVGKLDLSLTAQQLFDSTRACKALRVDHTPQLQGDGTQALRGGSSTHVLVWASQPDATYDIPSIQKIAQRYPPSADNTTTVTVLAGDGTEAQTGPHAPGVVYEPATRAKLGDAMQEIGERMDDGPDELFILFVIDHGGKARVDADTRVIPVATPPTPGGRSVTLNPTQPMLASIRKNASQCDPVANPGCEPFLSLHTPQQPGVDFDASDLRVNLVGPSGLPLFLGSAASAQMFPADLGDGIPRYELRFALSQQALFGPAPGMLPRDGIPYRVDLENWSIDTTIGVDVVGIYTGSIPKNDPDPRNYPRTICGNDPDLGCSEPSAYFRLNETHGAGPGPQPILNHVVGLTDPTDGYYGFGDAPGSDIGAPGPRPPDQPGFEGDNRALHCDVTDLVQFQTVFVDPPRSRLSVTGMVNPDGQSAGEIIGQFDAAGTHRPFSLETNASGQLGFRVSQNASPLHEAVIWSPDPLPPGRWSQVTASLGDGAMRLCIDGREVARRDFGVPTEVPNDVPLSICRGFDGMVDELAIGSQAFQVPDCEKLADEALGPVTSAFGFPVAGLNSVEVGHNSPRGIEAGPFNDQGSGAVSFDVRSADVLSEGFNARIRAVDLLKAGTSAATGCGGKRLSTPAFFGSAGVQSVGLGQGLVVADFSSLGVSTVIAQVLDQGVPTAGFSKPAGVVASLPITPVREFGVLDGPAWGYRIVFDGSVPITPAGGSSSVQGNELRLSAPGFPRSELEVSNCDLLGFNLNSISVLDAAAGFIPPRIQGDFDGDGDLDADDYRALLNRIKLTLPDSPDDDFDDEFDLDGNDVIGIGDARIEAGILDMPGLSIQALGAATAATQAPPVLSLQTGTPVVPSGQPLALDLVLSDLAGTVGGLALEIRYDPAAFALDGVSFAGALGSADPQLDHSFDPAAQTAMFAFDTPGLVQLYAVSLLDEAQLSLLQQSGAFTLATLDFTARAPSAAQFEVAAVDMVDGAQPPLDLAPLLQGVEVQVSCASDTDGDTICDDGDGSAVAGDNRCAGGATAICDDNCIGVANALQEDQDGDAAGNACDTCPFHASANLSDTDGDGRGDDCECTDQNGDGRNTVSDLVAINLAIFNPGLVTPLCDGDGDGLCNVKDIIAANVEIFSPTNTSTCARQPVPGP